MKQAVIPYRHNAFTLVEVIVVIGILALVLPIITTILFGVLRQQILVTRITEAKRQGDQAMGVIQTNVSQDAATIYRTVGGGVAEVCNIPSSIETLDYFMDVTSVNKIEVTLSTIDGILRLNGSPITNTKVTVTNLVMQCYRKALHTNPLVKISFAIAPSGNIPSSELTQSTLFYSSIVMIRK